MVDLSPIVPLLLSWYEINQEDLPWRQSRDPYAIWVSEIMAQQTKITTVIPYYKRWMTHFPYIEVLAKAPLSDVLKLWEGLGYYSRVRNLHDAAQTIINELHGQLPKTVTGLQKLKGIGPYTAGAIASICFDIPEPVLDGNVIRVLSRLLDLIDDVTQAKTKKYLWQVAKELVPTSHPGNYNQAIMELGQKVCTPQKPLCLICPIRKHCLAARRGTQLERPVRPPRKRTPHYDVVAGIIWRNEQQFLITQRPLDGLLGGLWEFPGGKVEKGESYIDALKREIQEELGIEITVTEHQTTVKHAYTHFRITLYAYHAQWKEGQIQHLGVIDHAWVTLTDLTPYAFAKTDQQIIASLQK